VNSTAEEIAKTVRATTIACMRIAIFTHGRLALEDAERVAGAVRLQYWVLKLSRDTITKAIAGT